MPARESHEPNAQVCRLVGQAATENVRAREYFAIAERRKSYLFVHCRHHVTRFNRVIQVQTVEKEMEVTSTSLVRFVPFDSPFCLRIQFFMKLRRMSEQNGCFYFLFIFITLFTQKCICALFKTPGSRIGGGHFLGKTRVFGSELSTRAGQGSRMHTSVFSTRSECAPKQLRTWIPWRICCSMARSFKRTLHSGDLTQGIWEYMAISHP